MNLVYGRGSRALASLNNHRATFTCSKGYSLMQYLSLCLSSNNSIEERCLIYSQTWLKANHSQHTYLEITGKIETLLMINKSSEYQKARSSKIMGIIGTSSEFSDIKNLNIKCHFDSWCMMITCMIFENHIIEDHSLQVLSLMNTIQSEYSLGIHYREYSQFQKKTKSLQKSTKRATPQFNHSGPIPQRRRAANLINTRSEEMQAPVTARPRYYGIILLARRSAVFPKDDFSSDLECVIHRACAGETKILLCFLYIKCLELIWIHLTLYFIQVSIFE